MAVDDAEIERLAREMIATFGTRAAQVATERLNDMIDRENPEGRDIWACVVHWIHEHEGTGPSWAQFPKPWRNLTTRFAENGSSNGE